MQVSTWTPTVIQNSLPCPPQIPYKDQFCPTPWMRYGLQLKSFDQPINPQAYSGPVSTSANTQSNCTPQMFSRESQNQLPYVFPAPSGHHPLPSVVGHHGSSKARQVETFNVNPNCDPQLLNSSNQRNYKTQHSMQNDTCSNTNYVIGNSHCMHDAIQPWQHQLNRQHPEVQAQYRVTPNTVANFPVASHMPVDSSHWFLILNTPITQSQTQNASRQSSPCRKDSSQAPVLQNGVKRKSDIPNLANQETHRFSHISPNNRIQSRATTDSSHHGKTNLAFSVNQSSTQQQVIQSNTTMNKLTHSQDITCLSRFTSHTSPTSGSESAKNSQNLLHTLLKKDISQLRDLHLSSKTFGFQFARSQQAALDNTTGYITTGENYCQAMASQRNKHQGPAKERKTKTGASSHQAGAQKLSHNQLTNWKKGNEEKQSYIDLAAFKKVAKSQLGMVRQVNKAVAVVPPISQQTLIHTQNDVSTDTHLSLPLKTNTVKNLEENLEKGENVQNVTLKLIEGVPRVLTPAGSSPILRPSSRDIPKMPTSEKGPTPDSQRCDISHGENGPTPLTQIPNGCQDVVHVVDSTSKGSIEQRDVQEVESSPEDTRFDLSTVPVVNYSLKELRHLVKSLEITPAETDRLTETNFLKCIKDLYYNGAKQNVANIESFKELLKTSSEFCIKDLQGVVLRSLLPVHLQMLENCSQILINTTIPSEDFKSSWLNIDGQPADVENVLAEPISDYNLTWCKKVSQSVSESVVNVVDTLTQIDTDNIKDHEDISAQQTTTENIPEICHRDPVHSSETDDTMILEEGCVSRPCNKLSGGISKNGFNQQLHDDVDMVKNNKEVFNEPSLTSSSDELVRKNTDVFEKADASDDADSTDALPELIPLSSEEVKTIFSECSESGKKREPDQICQEEKKDLVTYCAKAETESVNVRPLNDFKFTCPHVNGLTCGSGLFCPDCWNETPILNIDQDETLLPVMKKELKMEPQRQNHSMNSKRAIECLKALVYSIKSTRESGGSDVMKDPHLRNQMQRSSAQTAEEQHHKTAGIKNSSVTMPVVEDTSSKVKAKVKPLKKVDSSSRTKILTEMVSGSGKCINVKSTKTDVLPDDDDDDILFSPDFVIEYSSTHKQHSSNRRSASGNDVQCSNQGLDQLSQTPNISATPKCKTILPKHQKRPITMEKGHNGQCKKTKKLRLELYGSKNGNLGLCEKRFPSTPVYLTVCSSSNAEKSYTDEP